MSYEQFYDKLQQREHLNVLNKQTTKHVELKKVEINGGEFSDTYYESLLNPSFGERNVFALKDLNTELSQLKERLEYSGLFKDISINVDLDKSSATKMSKTDYLTVGAVPVTAKVNLTQVPIFKFSSYSSSTDYDAASGIRYLDPNFLKNASTLLVDINVNYDPFNKTLNRKIWDLAIMTPFSKSPSLKAIFNPSISLIDAKSWASHTQHSKGGLIGVQKTWLSTAGDSFFTNGLSFTHRNVGDVSNSASDVVRTDAGDDFKLGLQSNYRFDTRKFLGQFALNGVNFDVTNEFAGFNSVDAVPNNAEKEGVELNKFNKTVFKFEGFKSFFNNTFTTALDFKAGSIFTLDSNKTDKLHISDRFFLGGLTSLKGFHLNSVGLKNGNDYIGGSSFFKAGFTFFSKIPNTSTDSPLRLYNFINAGDVFNFQSFNQFKDSVSTGDLIRQSAIATGVGLAYRSKNALLDLSYSIPLSDRSQDNAKPGLSFSVSLNFF